MLFGALLLLTTPQTEPTPGHPIALPSQFVSNRFFVTPEADSGLKLRFYTDSAGGLFLSAAATKSLNPQLTAKELANGRQVKFPTFKPGKSIPIPLGVLFKGYISVFALSKADVGGTDIADVDGLLGQQWFSGRTWTFDYPKKKLWWRAPGDLPKHDPIHEQKLFFKTNPKGGHTTDFARIEIGIDGELVSFTLDTGAVDALPADALKFVGDNGPSVRATSFLGQGMFDKLHVKHPDWRVYSHPTSTGSKLLEVPKVTIGGYEVGPVWFSIQPDQAFHEYMAQWTDKPTEGSIGGSAFRYFKMTVDWPGAVAVFEKR